MAKEAAPQEAPQWKRCGSLLWLALAHHWQMLSQAFALKPMSYSVTRMEAFCRYQQQTSSGRILFVVLATPMPCIAWTSVLNSLPLTDPDRGLKANYMVFLRAAVSVYVCFAGLQWQRPFYLPAMTASSPQDHLVRVLITVSYTLVMLSLSWFIKFPFPFMMILPMVVTVPLGLMLLPKSVRGNAQRSLSLTSRDFFGIRRTTLHLLALSRSSITQLARISRKYLYTNQAGTKSNPSSSRERGSEHIQKSRLRQRLTDQVLNKYRLILCFNVSLLVMYPLVGYGFNHLRSQGSLRFVYIFVFPVLRYLMTRLCRRLCWHVQDVACETMAFTVVFFNALFVTTCVSSAWKHEEDLSTSNDGSTTTKTQRQAIAEFLASLNSNATIAVLCSFDFMQMGYHLAQLNRKMIKWYHFVQQDKANERVLGHNRQYPRRASIVWSLARQATRDKFSLVSECVLLANRHRSFLRHHHGTSPKDHIRWKGSMGLEFTPIRMKDEIHVNAQVLQRLKLSRLPFFSSSSKADNSEVDSTSNASDKEMTGERTKGRDGERRNSIIRVIPVTRPVDSALSGSRYSVGSAPSSGRELLSNRSIVETLDIANAGPNSIVTSIISKSRRSSYSGAYGSIRTTKSIQSTRDEHSTLSEGTMTPEKMEILRETLCMLFMMERLVLVEYVKATTPFLYAAFLWVTWNSPNAKFIITFQELHAVELHARVISVMILGFWQSVSLMVLFAIVQWRMKINVFALLAFVLESHLKSIQGKLAFFLTYLVSVNVQHYGMYFTSIKKSS